MLDEGTNTQVPVAINTYLRDYQREGVKFFWNQYHHSRGGLLGDDMGLVSCPGFGFICVGCLFIKKQFRVSSKASPKLSKLASLIPRLTA